MQKTVDLLIIKVAHPSQTNRLYDAGLVIQYQLYDIEVYYEDCRVTQYYRCKEYGHIAKHYRNTEICGKYRSAIYKINVCEAQAVYSNYTKVKRPNTGHFLWAKECPIRAEKMLQIRAAYEHRSTRYHSSEAWRTHRILSLNAFIF